MIGLRKLAYFFGLMHFVKTFVKDTDNFAILNKKITLTLGLLIYFFKVLP